MSRRSAITTPSTPLRRGRKQPSAADAKAEELRAAHGGASNGSNGHATNGVTPKPARPKLTAAEKLARAEEKAKTANRQVDIMRTRSMADDAKIVTGQGRKTAMMFAREANALAVLAGRLGADTFLRLRDEIANDIERLQRDDPSLKDVIDGADESGTSVEIERGAL